MANGPIIAGYDGSAEAARAITEMAALVAKREAVIVSVWEPHQAWQVVDPLMPLAPVDIRVRLTIEKELLEGAQRTAEQGATVAREAGLVAEGIAVADDLSVAATLVRIADETQASAIAVGAHGHRALRELVLGSTTRDVIRDAPCPVVVAGPAEKGKAD